MLRSLVGSEMCIRDSARMQCTEPSFKLKLRCDEQQAEAIVAQIRNQGAAASRIQGVHRGNGTRKEVAAMERDEAATKIQAGHRGNSGRQEADRVKRVRDKAEQSGALHDELAQVEQEHDSATKIQAAQRGHVAREEAVVQGQHAESGGLHQELVQAEEEHDAAVTIQTAHRTRVVAPTQHTESDFMGPRPSIAAPAAVDTPSAKGESTETPIASPVSYTHLTLPTKRIV
eukprot:TRINITY_DN6813_c0_g1_i3.p1 TRINITY_DN6813_c0_g1~~TRINITY_DN6813_c0_g1_i3.p1  ORF type:complete len:230 (-),score=64.22 TRINITY_DN6813_c0_g1_i3:73-762(-)